jgi:predicted nucleic acid-binding protein
MKHLLDTSAILVHFLDEPGADLVTNLLSAGKRSVFLSAPSWAELERRLNELLTNQKEVERVWSFYTEELCGFLPLDEAAVRAAIELRRTSAERLPLVDSLIAGCAFAHKMVLVHRDAHMEKIQLAGWRGVSLPEKKSQLSS